MSDREWNEHWEAIYANAPVAAPEDLPPVGYAVCIQDYEELEDKYDEALAELARIKAERDDWQRQAYNAMRANPPGCLVAYGCCECCETHGCDDTTRVHIRPCNQHG